MGGRLEEEVRWEPGYGCQGKKGKGEGGWWAGKVIAEARTRGSLINTLGGCRTALLG